MVSLTVNFQRWARIALAQYPLDAASLTFLGHSDNITFRVEDGQGASFLLRLHDPVIPYYRGMRQRPEAIASELTWMEALLGEGGIRLQQPVRSTSGESLCRSRQKKAGRSPARCLPGWKARIFLPQREMVPSKWSG